MKRTFCNICGKAFDDFDSIGNNKIHKKMSYGSKYDGDYVAIDICCECMDKLIDSCKISPIEQFGPQE